MTYAVDSGTSEADLPSVCFAAQTPACGPSASKSMRHRNRLPSCEILHRVFRYDVNSGDLTWKERPHPNSPPAPGSSAAHQKGHYLLVCLDGKKYLTHRIIWKMMTGVEPSEEIDHVDGNGLNNRWSNLREATRLQNNANQRVKKVKLGGTMKGVTLRPSGRFSAGIRVNGKTTHLGTFSTQEAAHAAYIVAARNIFGEFASNGVRA